MNRTVAFVMLSVVALVTTAPAVAQSVPQSVKIQGYLSDRVGGTTVPANGSYNMTFEIFDAPSGGVALTTVGPIAIMVTNGVYEASITTGTTAFTGSSRHLQITVNGEVLSPRLRIDSAPYALRSDSAVEADTVAPGAVGVAGLADGSVTASKIGIPCADGQILLRTSGVWACAALPVATAVCTDGSYLSCYPGPAGTAGVGVCRVGVSTCKPDRSGFTACAGAVTPVSETCDNLDNDCDGQVDEVCVYENYGWPTAFGGTTNVGNGAVLAYRVTVPTATTLDRFGVYTASSSGDWKLAIYTDAGNLPGTLVAAMGARASIVAPGTNEFNVTDVPLAAGTYWIAYRSSPLLTMGYSGASQTATLCTRTTVIPSLDTAWPATFGTANCMNTGILNIYFVTYRIP